MSSVDEPIFEAEETGESEILIEVPGKTVYIGSIPAGAIESDMPTLYFDFEVAKQLQSEGQRSIKTDKEVAGILLGVSSGDGQQIKVSHIAIARDEDSSPVHFKFTYSVWDDLIDQMETLSREAGEELLLLGWYHTHPNMSVFLSRYDLRTHRDFHRPYQFALVLAPRRGTADTSVGFFVNRQGGTPLLPGIHMYGARSRGEVTGALPWKFQILEAEGIEEGDGSDEDEVDDTPILHQVGVVRAEDADWLTLGNDPAEGPVTTILEGMAAAVVEGRQDRLGVLLGGKTPDQHITINRVRFLGHLSGDPTTERGDLVGALRFMAQTFPATGEPKILGVVRIVSPHRFKAGDVYDPVANNIQIAMFLKEVGYDLDEVPFQVGLVLYPGIEEDTVLFHVLAQNKMSRPVPLMSLQAISPPSEKPNERWEPIGEPTFTVDRDPCMSTSGVVPPSLIGTSAASARMKDLARTLEAEALPAAGGTSSGIDWDELPDDDDDGSSASNRRGLGAVILVLGVLALLVAVLVVLNVLASKQGGPGTAPIPDGPDEGLTALGEPYSWTLTGCGPGWNPGVACDPFAQVGERAEMADLLRLQRKEAYIQATIQPIEVWLLAEGERRRHKLVRAAAGTGAYSFTVGRTGDGWDEFWGTDNLPFPATLVILPQGAELTLDDEWTWLRRTEQLRLVAPPPLPESPDELATASTSDEPGGDPDPVLVPSAGDWRWKAGSSMLETSYDTARSSFARPLVLNGGSETAGTWKLRLRSARRGRFVATTTALNPETDVGALDLGRFATALMRDPEAVSVLEGKTVGEKVYIHVTPPRSTKDLVAEVELTGGAPAATSTEHRVCVMMVGPEGDKADGRARVGSDGVMRPTFDPSKGSLGECADGGATGRWTNVEFGPGVTHLEFIYEGPDWRPAKGVVQKSPLPPRWTSSPGKCISVSIVLDASGWQGQAPTLTPLHDFVDGKCQ